MARCLSVAVPGEVHDLSLSLTLFRSISLSPFLSLSISLSLIINVAGASQRGPLSVAVPGEVHGYWQAKTRYDVSL